MKFFRKVAFYLSDLHEGGAENAMVILANEFASMGFEVDFVLAKATGGFLTRLSTKINIVDLNVRNKYLSLWGLVRYFQENTPVVMLSTLHVNNIMTIAAKKIARADSSRVVIRVATIVSGQIRVFWKKALEKIVLSLVYPWADAIVSVSKTVSSDLSIFLNLPPEKIVTIYNPSITEDMYQKSRNELLHPWFQTGGAPVVLGVGRLTVDKDYETLIRAVFRVSKLMDVRLVILGDGDQRKHLENLAIELDIGDLVEIAGFVDNPFQYMRKASVFVLPSLWEGLPNVLIEAMMCGCPVIATDCPGGVREILDNGNYGFLIPTRDPDEMAKRIVDVLQGKKILADDQWLNQFKVENVIRHYMDILHVKSTE